MSVEPNSKRSGEAWFIDAASKSEIAKMRRSLYVRHYEIGSQRAAERFEEHRSRHEEYLRRCAEDQ